MPQLLGVGGGERQVRRLLEDDRDLGHPARQPLAGAQVERHAGPATGLDVEPDRGIGLGGRRLRDVLLVDVGDDPLPAQPALLVLAAHRVALEVGGQLDRAQHLGLLGPDRLRVEGDRLLHRGQSQQLQHVVLQHVARSTRRVVEAGPAADADVLGHRDLHRVDEVAVPHRLEHRVGEPQRQQVLDGLLAQVVVDPEDVLGGEDLVHQPVEVLAALQVVAERLLDHDAPPATALGVVGHPGALHLLEHDREHRRRDREVERRVALDAVRLLHADQRLGQGVEGVVVVERAGHEPDAVGQPGPDVVPEAGAGAVLRGLAGQLGEVAVTPVAPGEADHREAGRQQAAVGQVVDRGDQLLASQVTGHPEHDQRARARHPGEPAVAGVAQRVGQRGDPDQRRLLRRQVAQRWVAGRHPVASAAASSCRIPAARSVRCSRTTGRPRSVRARRSPSACASCSRPNV